MNPFKKHICEVLANSTGKTFEEVALSLEVPPNNNWGNYGWPCFNMAKLMKKAPPLIALELAEKIKPDKYISAVSAQEPYLNFTLDKKAVIDYVCRQIFPEGKNYGKSAIGGGKKVIIEYSSPNVAKPMGIGHLRSTVIGAALRRIYEYLGYSVISINHLGDWGTQFGKLVVAYKRWADPNKMKTDPIKELYRIYVKIHSEAEADNAIEDESRAMFKRLENGDPEVVELWHNFVELSLDDFNKIYAMLGVKFDSFAGESFYQEMVAGLIRLLDEKGLPRESEGALIVPLDDYGLEPLLLRKKDGSTLYGTRDLAAAIYRHETYDFDKMIYVVGVAQSLHFKQFFKVLELAGFDWVRNCQHVDFGWVKLGSEMMSTRLGNIVFLDDVINQTIDKAAGIIATNCPDLENRDEVARQVGIGAVIFADLSVKRQTDVSFDWDRMLDFSGYSGPYLQYAHARLSSLLRKYDGEIDINADYGLLTLPEEYLLANSLLEFPDKIIDAANHNEPYIISTYLLELVGLFSTYYQKYKSPKDKILSDDLRLRQARINLTYCVKTVLNSGLSILGLEAPEKM